MPNKSRAFYRLPFEKSGVFFEDNEQTLSSFPDGKTGYIISYFEGNEFQFIEASGSETEILFENNFSAGIQLPETISHDFFIDYIGKIQSEIKNGSLDKVVACRCKQIELSDDFEINSFIKSLCAKYENAYISVYQGKKGTFISATPELLLKTDKNKRAESVALAGTAKWSEKENLGHKESEEQGIIVKHIEEVLERNSITFDETDKYIVQAGHLAHLVNKFNFELGNIQLSDFLPQIHPTPAIGLAPHSAGTDFIFDNEGWNRGFYTGYSGIVSEKITNLSINIRSIFITGKKALIQAGAGITLDSVPEKEWLETEEKMKTIESLIQ